MTAVWFGDGYAARVCVCQIMSDRPMIIRDAFGDEARGIVDDFGNVVAIYEV